MMWRLVHLIRAWTEIEAYQIALQQLERLNIVRLKDRSVNTLSGGEQNFTALAGVLAMQPKSIVIGWSQ